ncbi:MAG: AAA family ATPase [Candidatus Thermoplasmatota archaeon]|jgi:2-phosphoglycerate kinase|nr:AAA family ATPase [Candidatus Thermoplasmatota archaeon]MCL5785561.1 AAA family ATPase [Candidatus Thermoplasmatota archaeon]
MSRIFPVVIGGVPGVGKSSISGYVARELGIDLVMSGDYLREFARGLPLDDSAGNLSRSVYDAWKDYGDLTNENVVKGFLEQSMLMSNAMVKVLERSIANGEPMIIETLYFSPEMIPVALRSRVLLGYIYISDESVHRQRLLERTSYTHANSPGQRLASHLKEYRIIMNHCRKESEDHDIRVFDNLDYLPTRKAVLNFVEEKVDRN